MSAKQYTKPPRIQSRRRVGDLTIIRSHGNGFVKVRLSKFMSEGMDEEVDGEVVMGRGRSVLGVLTFQVTRSTSRSLNMSFFDNH